MPTKHKTTKWSTEIETIEILDETDKMVTLADSYRKRRELKISGYHRYHDTWEEAHAFLLRQATREIENAEQRLQRFRHELEEILAMQEPKE